MKALTYIAGIVTLALSSCTSMIYMGSEVDDLYYSPSDRNESYLARQTANKPVGDGRTTD